MILTIHELGGVEKLFYDLDSSFLLTDSLNTISFSRTLTNFINSSIHVFRDLKNENKQIIENRMKKIAQNHIYGYILQDQKELNNYITNDISNDDFRYYAANVLKESESDFYNKNLKEDCRRDLDYITFNRFTTRSDYIVFELINLRIELLNKLSDIFSNPSAEILTTENDSIIAISNNDESDKEEYKSYIQSFRSNRNYKGKIYRNNISLSFNGIKNENKNTIDINKLQLSDYLYLPFYEDLTFGYFDDFIKYFDIPKPYIEEGSEYEPIVKYYNYSLEKLKEKKENDRIVLKVTNRKMEVNL